MRKRVSEEGTAADLEGRGGWDFKAISKDCISILPGTNLHLGDQTLSVVETVAPKSTFSRRPTVSKCWTCYLGSQVPVMAEEWQLLKVKISCSVMSDCNPMDCSPPGSSVHGILQARIVEWIAISFSRGSSQPKDRTHIPCIAGEFFTIWAPGSFLLERCWVPVDTKASLWLICPGELVSPFFSVNLSWNTFQWLSTDGREIFPFLIGNCSYIFHSPVKEIAIHLVFLRKPVFYLTLLKSYHVIISEQLHFPYNVSPSWLRWWRICLQCRRPKFYPWVRKIPWRRAWQPTHVLAWRNPWTEEPGGVTNNFPYSFENLY